MESQKPNATKRSLRRHHRLRMKQRAKWVAKHLWGTDYSPERAARFGDTISRCSCHACGNQRYYWGPTWQERKQREKEHLDER